MFGLLCAIDDQHRRILRLGSDGHWDFFIHDRDSRYGVTFDRRLRQVLRWERDIVEDW